MDYQLIKFILSASAASWILTKGSIFKNLRVFITTERGQFQAHAQVDELSVAGILYLLFFKFLDAIFNCPACMGFWVGILFSPFFMPVNYWEWFFFGLIASGCSLQFATLYKFLNK